MPGAQAPMCAEAGGGPEFVPENPHKMSQARGWRDGPAVKSTVVLSTHTLSVSPASGDSVLCSGLHNNHMHVGAHTHTYPFCNASDGEAITGYHRRLSWALWPVSLG